MTTGILGRPKRRREVTVELLLDAALETFAEVGFAAASVEDICRRGGFTRGAFYSSFSTKDELFGTLFAREAARNLGQAQQRLEGVEHEADPVTAAVDRCLSAFRADRSWVLVYTEYRLHAARSPHAREALVRHTADVLDGLTRLIADTAARAGVRLRVSPGRLAAIVSALHDGAVVARVTDGPADDTDDDDLERTALLLLLRGAVDTTDLPTRD